MKQEILMDLIRRAKDEGSFTESGNNFFVCSPTEEEQLFLASQRVLVYIDHDRSEIFFKNVPEQREYEVVVHYTKTYVHNFVVKASGEDEAEAEAMELAGVFDFNQCSWDGDYEAGSILKLVD